MPAQATAFYESNLDNLLAAVSQEMGRLPLGIFAGTLLNSPPDQLFGVKSLRAADQQAKRENRAARQ